MVVVEYPLRGGAGLGSLGPSAGGSRGVGSLKGEHRDGRRERADERNGTGGETLKARPEPIGFNEAVE